MLEETRLKAREITGTGFGDRELDGLRATHHEILRYIVIGMSNREIAQIMGCSPSTVSNVRKSQVAREYLAEMNRERDEKFINMDRKLKETATEALGVLEDILAGRLDGQGVSLEERARTAKFLMKCAGKGPITKSKDDKSVKYGLDDETLRIIDNMVKEKQRKRVGMEGDVIEVKGADVRIGEEG